MNRASTFSLRILEVGTVLSIIDSARPGVCGRVHSRCSVASDIAANPAVGFLEGIVVQRHVSTARDAGG